MPTPSSGTIKFSNLSNEFGPTTNVSLGAYRLNGGQTAGTLSNLPLDTDIPKSGSISMSQFYNKRLNVVINYTNLPDNSTQQALQALNIPYKAVLGVNPNLLSLDIYYFSNFAVNKPVIVYIHGGGWRLGDKQGIADKGTLFFK